jgi:NAD(P)-dependent dehydrogenase (short-subunit alcohol dehydrogenase family)
MKRFTSKVAIVTGGARGIGEAAVRRLAREGASVVVADVLDREGEALARELQLADHRAIYEHTDVSIESDWMRVVDRATRTFGPLGILVNNAGIARIEDVETETVEGFERLIAVNQTGMWLGMKTAIPRMRDAGGGSVVNVSSIYGAVGGNGTAIAYHASKGAVRLMTKNAAIRYAKDNVRVNSVHPGFIETPMVAPFTSGDEPAAKDMREYITRGTPMGRIGRSSEVAAAIAFLASDDASYVTGAELYVDGGWTAW